MATLGVGTVTPYLLSPVTGQRTLITNDDTTDSIIIADNEGAFSAQPSGTEGGIITDPAATIIDPGGQIVVDGTWPVWGLAISETGDPTDIVQVRVQTGALAVVAGPETIATALITSGFATAVAQAISQALATGGISILGNPVALYNIGPSGGGTAPGQWGATTFAATGQSWISEFNSFQTVTGRPITTYKIYMNTYSVQFPSTLAQIQANVQLAYLLNNPGVRGCLCFNVAVDGSDVTKLNNCLAALRANGLTNLLIILWQEVQDPAHGVSASQFIALSATYRSTITSNGYLQCYDSAGSQGINAWNAYDPFPNVDMYSVDSYWLDYNKDPANRDPALLVNLAHTRGKPWGVHEMGVSVGSEKFPPTGMTLTQAQSAVKTFINHIRTLVTTDLTGGLPVDSCMWYYSPKGNLNNDPTPYVPQIQALADSLTQTAATATTINPGHTTTLPPLTPSPTAGYGIANGIGYDLYINLVAGTGSTNPFCRLRIFWYDSDDPNAKIADFQQWTLPMGNTTGTNIFGKGPQTGSFVKIQIINDDSVACQFQMIFNSNSRSQARHDLRWDSNASVVVPGYTLSGQALANESCLGAISGFSLPANTTQSWLVSLFAGSVYVRLGTAAASPVIQGSINVAPQGTGAGQWGTTQLLNEQLQGTSATSLGDFTQEIISPRAPLLVSMKNTDSSPHNVSWALTALE